MFAALRAFTADWWFYSWFLGWAMTAKLAGVIAMFASILVLCLLPWLDRSKVRSGTFRPYFKQVFWLFFIDCLILGYVGAKPSEGVLVYVGQWATLFYFGYLVVWIPLCGIFERPKALPESISAAVTAGGKE